jgi:Luciferase-like monooxygenase
MEIGIGLPNTVLGVPGRLMVDWARRAEEGGFSSLATIDRVAYPSYDSLTALTAAAAVTERIGLLTNVLLEPLYPPVLLAKVTASLDQLSAGRLTLGIGVGSRPDDYELADRSFGDRGRRFDADLELLHQAWAGQPVAGAIQEFTAAWEQAGGTGKPRVVVLSYFSLGEEHTETSLANLRSYYGFLGDWAEGIASGAARTEAAIRDTAAAFEDVGVDELIFDPTVPALDQVDRLAEALR